MNYRDLQLAFKFELKSTVTKPDRQVNHGCNLKWKPGDNKDVLLATTIFHRGINLGRFSTDCIN